MSAAQSMCRQTNNYDLLIQAQLAGLSQPQLDAARTVALPVAVAPHQFQVLPLPGNLYVTCSPDMVVKGLFDIFLQNAVLHMHCLGVPLLTM